MFNTRTIWVLIFCVMLSACNTTNGLSAKSNTDFRYVNEAKDVAVWDVENKTITLSNETIVLKTCDAGNQVCFEAGRVKIVVPKSCTKRTFYAGEDSYKPRHGITVLGHQALTGGINYFESERKKFGYTYHPSRGVMSLKLLPQSKPIYADSGFKIVPYIYYLDGDRGPFACIED